jgi:hypothetical protein
MAGEADKRSTHTDALASLGTIIGSGEKRDAIHIAVEPAQAVHTLHPGDHVGRHNDGGIDGYGFSDQPLGIVDPFLEGEVKAGEWFWLLVYPRQITSLRHVWEHPSFAAERNVSPLRAGWKVTPAESELWLRHFCETSDCPGFESVMRAIEGDHDDREDGYYNTSLDEEALHFGGSDAHGEIPPEFWDHYKNFTGKEPRARAKYFSCSC